MGLLCVVQQIPNTMMQFLQISSRMRDLLNHQSISTALLTRCHLLALNRCGPPSAIHQHSTAHTVPASDIYQVWATISNQLSVQQARRYSTTMLVTVLSQLTPCTTSSIKLAVGAGTGCCVPTLPIVRPTRCSVLQLHCPLALSCILAVYGGKHTPHTL